MVKSAGLSRIRQWKRRWTIFSVITAFLTALGLTLLATAITYYFYQAAMIPPVIFIVSFSALAVYHRLWRISDEEAVRRFNRSFPELEESTQLLLREPGSLNLLESLQVERINEKLAGLAIPAAPANRLVRSSLVFAGTVAVAFAIYRLPAHGDPAPMKSSAAMAGHPRSIPAEIRTAAVTIRPPAYTGKKSRRQKELQIQADAGSIVTWNLETTQPVRELVLLLNNKTRLSFRRANAAGTRWLFSRRIDSPGFYQLETGGKLSDLYQIGVIPDKAPGIAISAPAPRTVIDFGMSGRIPLHLAVSDDYALSAASVVATVASGKGESVSFREHRLSLKGFVPGSRKADIRDLLDLPRLGMKPGDELFFYASATDNRGQVSRTDIFTVTMADTAELMSIEGLTTGVNLMPEYFRSQRQIILDTEKLLRERDTLAVQEFRNRSNNLGLDQKLLRLRYGKFLGEESESEVGESDHGEADHAEAGAPPVRFGDPASMIDAVSHKHDNSEDATFFEPAQKAQLKAVLTEMWKAELQLRVFKPAAALPFEYKALRLLKDLQQKSRAYVGKTGIKTPPLKPEKRLTGELESIRHVMSERKISQKPDPMRAVREAISLLEAIKQGSRPGPEAYAILGDANVALNQYAIRQPALYLPAVRSMQNIMRKSGETRMADAGRVQSAFYRMLGETSRVPAAGKTGSSGLSDQYFKKLNTKLN